MLGVGSRPIAAGTLQDRSACHVAVNPAQLGGNGVSNNYAGREYMSWALRDAAGDQSHTREASGADVWTIKADFVVRGHSTETSTWECIGNTTASEHVVRDRNGSAVVTITISIVSSGGLSVGPADLQDMPISGTHSDEENSHDCNGSDSTRDVSLSEWFVPDFGVGVNIQGFQPGQRASHGHRSNDPNIDASTEKVEGPSIFRHPKGPYGDTRWDLSLCSPN